MRFTGAAGDALPATQVARRDAKFTGARVGAPGRRYLILASAVVLGVVLVAWPTGHSLLEAALVVATVIAGGAVAVLERRSPRLGLRPVVMAIGVLFFVAVITPPRTSHDLWSYTMYGRIVSVHHGDPYVDVPAQFPGDPFLGRVSPVWQHRASVFGPLWVAYEAAGARVSGTSPVRNRLFFQLSAAAAAAGALVLVWRRTRSPAALAWLGLNPAFGIIAINGGHNDILVGLLILVAASLCTKRRGWAAGFVLGLAALIKVTALLALVGIVLWAWRHRERRIALCATAGAAITVSLGYLPFYGGAAHVLSGADHTTNPASAWNGLADLVVGHNGGRDVPNPLAHNPTLNTLFFLAVGLVAVLALSLGWRTARARRAELPAGTTTATYTFAATYTYPWYAAWALPALTDTTPTPIAWVVWIQSAIMLAALALPVHVHGTLPDAMFRGFLTNFAPVAILAAFIITGTRSLPTDTSQQQHEHGAGALQTTT
jgi:alpha-1,6-mannosyltransferase